METEVRSRARRATQAIGLVLVGTAALALGGVPGCKDDRTAKAKGKTSADAAKRNASTQPTTRRSRAYVGSGFRGAGAAAAAAAAAAGAHTGTVDASRSNNTVRRSGFGSSARSSSSSGGSRSAVS